MNNPLTNRTVTVPAGATGIVEDVTGKHVKIVSCTVASVLMGFDAGNVERVYPDDCYAGPLEGFKHLRFVADVGACTVVIQVAEQPILSGSLTSLATISATLGTIDTNTDSLPLILAEMQGPTAAAAFGNETTLAATTATSILAANANAHGRFIQAKSTNTASIFIGPDNTVTDTKWMIELAKGQGYTFDDYRGPLYAYSVAGGDIIAFGEW